MRGRCVGPLILNLGTRWGEWSASHCVRFTPWETALGTHWTGLVSKTTGACCENRNKKKSVCVLAKVLLLTQQS